MNDRLKNMKVQPDPEVWQGIQKSMHRAARLRRVTFGAAGVAVLGAVVTVALLWPRTEEPAMQSNESPMLAQVDRQDIPAVPTVDEVSVAQVTEGTASVEESQLEVTALAAATEEATVQTAVETGTAEVSMATASPKATVASTATPRQEPTPEEVSPALLVEAEPNVAEPVVGTEPDVVKIGGGAKVEDTILWIPNVFLPGSDNAEYNMFRVKVNKTAGSVTNFRMSVFNRAGHLVFHSNDINYGWDGTYRGQTLPQASYVYLIYYTDKDKVQHQRKGTITLVR